MGREPCADLATQLHHQGMGTVRNYQVPVLVTIHVGIAEERAATYTVLFPRQAGKNELAAHLVAGLLVSHAPVGGSIIVCAPTYAPQALISLTRTLTTYRRAGETAPPVRVDRNSVRCGAAAATFLGANPEAHVAGHTASIALIADEAQEIDRDWFDRQFRPMAASTGAPVVMFGTPWDGDTLLDRAVAHNRRHNAGRHFQVPWEAVAAEVERYGDYVRAERERLGRDHQLFRTQYDLRTGQPHGSLFSARQLAQLQGSHARLVRPTQGERYVAGLDVGGDGPNPDATVLTIGRVVGHRLEVVDHHAWHGAGFGMLIREAGELQRRWRLARIEVDATGIGAGLAGQLEAVGLPVERFSFTKASKSELGTSMRAAIETGNLALYADDASSEFETCLAEMRDCAAQWHPGGWLGWSNDRGHDDYVASLALCLHAAQSLGAPRVATGRRRE